MDIFLIRHTKVNTTEGVCYGQTDVGLAESFEKEKKNIQKKLSHHKFDVIYSSPLSRCLKLAGELFTGKEIIQDERLKELNFGNWEGRHWDEISTSEDAKDFFEDYINTACPNGESYQDLIKRVAEFYSEIKDNFLEKKVAIVSHGGPIRALLCIIEGISPMKAFERKVDYGTIIHLKIISPENLNSQS